MELRLVGDSFYATNGLRNAQALVEARLGVLLDPSGDRAAFHDLLGGVIEDAFDDGRADPVELAHLLGALATVGAVALRVAEISSEVDADEFARRCRTFLEQHPHLTV